MTEFFREFKKFISRGNVLDLAVGVVVGTAFQKIISSIVGDLVFPGLSPLLNVASFSEWQAGPIMIGNFIKNIVDFLIIAFFIFLVVKFANRFKRKEEIKEAQVTNKEVELLEEIRDLLKAGADTPK